MRLITPNEAGTAEWLDDPALYLTTRRWYPTLCVVFYRFSFVDPCSMMQGNVV